MPGFSRDALRGGVSKDVLGYVFVRMFCFAFRAVRPVSGFLIFAGVQFSFAGAQFFARGTVFCRMCSSFAGCAVPSFFEENEKGRKRKRTGKGGNGLGADGSGKEKRGERAG